MTFDPKKLHWDDVKSEVHEGMDYIEHIKSKHQQIMHKSNYKAYKPKQAVIENIKGFFESSDKSMKVLSLGATWCKTCANVKPSLIKIVEMVDSDKFKVFLLGGVKTKMGSTDEDYSWARKSPPEFHDPKFAVDKIPLVYFFNGDGQCVARVGKYPNGGKTYEEEILQIAQNKL